MRARAATSDLRMQSRNAVESVIDGVATLCNRFECVGERGEPEHARPTLSRALAGHVARHASGLCEAARSTRERDDRPCARDAPRGRSASSESATSRSGAIQLPK